MNNKLSVILFDLDGVLVETRKIHYEALQMALIDIGLNLSYEDHLQTFDGLPTYVKIDMLAKMHKLDSIQIKRLNDHKQKYTQELLQGQIFPSPELGKIFKYLKMKGIRSAVCSNTKRSSLDFILSKLEIDAYLEFSLSNEDVQNPKPDSEIYLKAMKQLNVNASETLIFEDSPHGIAAANGSKARVHLINAPSEITLDMIKKYCE